MNRHYIVSCCTAAILFYACMSSACFNPADKWAAGVVWNDGEQVVFSRLDLLGQTGPTMTKTGSGDSVVYTFRSHYAPDRAMVQLDFYTPPLAQQKASHPRIAIILDSTTANVPFNFSAALRLELDWLCCPVVGVLSMPLPERRRATDSIRQGNSQYWTRQDRVLPYNQWFTGDMQSGMWGTNGTRGDCGLDAAYSPPALPLGFAALDTFRVGFSADKFNVINRRTNEARLVAAVRETNGQYYFPYMSRMPEFANNFITGYFDYDSLHGKWDSVFVTLAIAGSLVSTRAPATPQSLRLREVTVVHNGIPSVVAINGRVAVHSFRKFSAEKKRSRGIVRF